MLRVGLISDTHGLLRAQAKVFLQGCGHIVHAGDIGRADILAELAQIAPVTAVRGNNDHGAWAEGIAETAMLELGGVRLYVIHDLARLDIDLAVAGVHVVIAGHSHHPSVQTRGSVLYVNPGSAGPRRFRLPVSAGELRIEGASSSAHLSDLLAPASTAHPRCRATR